MRLLMLGGVDRDMEKVAALAAAPLVGQKAPSQKPAWLLIKPPTCLYIVVDSEGQAFAPASVPQTRAAILNEIRAVLKAQGVMAVNPAEVEELVRIRTWSSSCYEFAHFTDEELASGIMAVHTTIGGWSWDELVGRWATGEAGAMTSSGSGEAGQWEEQQHKMTGPWEYAVSKTRLAEALWPVMRDKIDRCRVCAGAPVPEMVNVVRKAYYLAQRWRYQPSLLSEDDPAAEHSSK